MPYERQVFFESATLSWERVVLQAAAPSWSDEYRVGTSRLLLPLTHAFECQAGASRWTCDTRTALWLSPRQPYRMRRPWSRQRTLLLAVPAEDGPSARCEVLPAARVGLALLLVRWQRGDADPLELEEGSLAFARATRAGVSGPPRGLHPAVERAREFLAEHFADADRLGDIARAACCSPYHLARVFRLRTGSSLHAYRTHLRMSVALQRLQEGETDLSALAADIGYSSHAHFSAVFARVFGCAPSRLRTKLIARPAGQ